MYKIKHKKSGKFLSSRNLCNLIWRINKGMSTEVNNLLSPFGRVWYRITSARKVLNSINKEYRGDYKIMEFIGR